MVEVGANFGYYTLIMADAIGPEGSMTAFEANPHLEEILSTNIELNGFRGRAKAVPLAVAHTSSGELQLRTYKRHLGDSSILERDVEHGDAIRHLTVKSISLDDFFADDQRVDFIKIDAEGAEPLSFQGGKAPA